MTEKIVSPRETPPNAATKAEVARVRSRVEAIGTPWHEAVAKAGLSRNLGFTLLRGEGSVASLRKVDEWAATQETKKPPPTRAQARGAKMSEWATLGAELAELDPTKFEAMLDGLRDLVKAKRDEGAAILKMFRPNPDR